MSKCSVSFFQVREARFACSFDFLLVVVLFPWLYGLIAILFDWKSAKISFGSNGWLLHTWTMEELGIFAQASESRPSESTRSAPWTCVSCRSSDELLFWVRVYLAQARRSRLSERTRRPYSHFSSSRLGEKSSPNRENPLAWARTGRECAHVLFSPLFLDDCHMFGWITMLKHELSDFACIEWSMSWRWWVWYDLGMEHEWIVGYKCWYGIGMHDNFMLVGATWFWCGLGRNFMNL